MPSCDYQNADTQIYDKVTTNFTQTLPLSYLSVPNGAT
jgi:hypothetical protein